MTQRIQLAVLCLWLTALGAVTHAEPRAATELETRLFAPCCYVQTLDVHESELASALRRELRARLASGESARAIEDDMVRRYGERVLAVPRGRDPRSQIPTLVVILLTLSLLALVYKASIWRLRSRNAVTPTRFDPVYDAALDRELARSATRDTTSQ